MLTFHQVHRKVAHLSNTLIMLRQKVQLILLLQDYLKKSPLTAYESTAFVREAFTPIFMLMEASLQLIVPDAKRWNA